MIVFNLGLFAMGLLSFRFIRVAFLRRGILKESGLAFINNAKPASYGKLGDDSTSSYQFVTGYTYPAGGASDRPGGYVFNGSYINAVANKGLPILYYLVYCQTFDIGVDSRSLEWIVGHFCGLF